MGPDAGPLESRSGAFYGEAGATLDENWNEWHLGPVGVMGEMYPYDCSKSLRLLDQCCDFLHKANHGGHEATTALIGLALMSRGSSKYDPSIEKIKNTLVKRADGMAKEWNWNVG